MKNRAEAVAWYKKALAYGDPVTAYFLGGMYDIGRGVPQDSLSPATPDGGGIAIKQPSKGSQCMLLSCF